MKLEFDMPKKNTSGIQFRIDPETKRMLTALKNFYKVGTGVLIKKMIQTSYASLSDMGKGKFDEKAYWENRTESYLKETEALKEKEKL
jgi:hypothetical protein